MSQQQKDTAQQLNMSQTNDSAKEGSSLRYISAKLRKLSSVVYMLTNHLGAEEPLKRQLRSLSLEVLSMSFTLAGAEMTHSRHSDTGLYASLQEIVSLLEVAGAARMISSANVSVLVDEVNSMLSALEQNAPHTLSQLSSSDLEPEKVPRLAVSAPRQVQSDTQEKSAASAPGPTSSTGSIDGKKDVKPQKSTKKSKKSTNKLSKSKRRRRDAILKVMADEGEVGIKEISAEVDGCSRKTIQRELSDLIDAGLVIKEGERRWSTYQLSEAGAREVSNS